MLRNKYYFIYITISFHKTHLTVKTNIDFLVNMSIEYSNKMVYYILYNSDIY